MFNWLKMHFIPHEANDHRPHILHQKNIHRILGLVIFVEVFAFLIPSVFVITNANTGNILPDVLSTLTNSQRTSLGVPALAVSPLLNQAAQEKADDMATNHYFAHTSPDGKTPWYWFGTVGYNYSYAGENLAVNFTDATDLTNAWMNSPTHRANILKTDYTQIGTGVAEGTYQGNPTIFVAQVFGTPAPIDAAVAHTPTLSPAKTVAITTLPTAGATHVLGAETAAKKAVPTAPAAPTPTVAQAYVPPVLTADSEVTVQPTLWQRLVASPRNTTNAILFVIAGLVTLAVFLNIGIKISHHHPDLIINGVMAVAIIGCVFVVNNYISKSSINLIQSAQDTTVQSTS